MDIKNKTNAEQIEKRDVELVLHGDPLKPPEGFFAKAIAFIIDLIERGNIISSKFGNPPVYEKTSFPWAYEVESEWMKIREELDVIMKRREDLPSFHEITSEVESITTDQNWKTYFLAGFGIECEENSKRCPETARILKRIPGMKTAFFSILSPGKLIPPHRGLYNGVLRYHLGLIVPEPREQCRIRIGDQITGWSEGESLIFDDSFNHEVWNDTDGYRSILFVDFVRPLIFPFNLINKFVLDAAVFSPFIKEAQENQKNWEKKFYNN